MSDNMVGDKVRKGPIHASYSGLEGFYREVLNINVARIWTVLDTCCKQGRSAWQFLQNALSAYYFQSPTPSLLRFSVSIQPYIINR